jgi:hypothetical protein
VGLQPPEGAQDTLPGLRTRTSIKRAVVIQPKSALLPRSKKRNLKALLVCLDFEQAEGNDGHEVEGLVAEDFLSILQLKQGLGRLGYRRSITAIRRSETAEQHGARASVLHRSNQGGYPVPLVQSTVQVQNKEELDMREAALPI